MRRSLPFTHERGLPMISPRHAERIAMFRHRLMVLLGLCVVLVGSGCGPSKSSVTGRVTFKGKELSHGWVSFIGTDGLPVGADIQADGTYTVKGVLFGDNQITVTQIDPNAKTPSELRKEIEEKRIDASVLLSVKSLLPELESMKVTIAERNTTFDVVLVEKK